MELNHPSSLGDPGLLRTPIDDWSWLWRVLTHIDPMFNIEGHCYQEMWIRRKCDIPWPTCEEVHVTIIVICVVAILWIASHPSVPVRLFTFGQISPSTSVKEELNGVSNHNIDSPRLSSRRMERMSRALAQDKHSVGSSASDTRTSWIGRWLGWRGVNPPPRMRRKRD